MTNEKLARELIRNAHVAPENQVHCPCGVVRSMTAAFHRRQQVHDCVHHPRRACGFCRDFDSGMAAIQQRLRIEVEHGPFIVG